MHRLTVQDCVENLIDFMGAGAGDVVVRDMRRAIDYAYREVVNTHNWTYLYSWGRLHLDQPFSDGMISWDAGTNIVTLTPNVSAGFPAWVGAGSEIRCVNVASRVLSIIDSTHLQLDPTVTWGGLVVPTNAPYSIYHDAYLLPEDFTSQSQGMYEWNFGGLDYVHPKEWLHRQRYAYRLGTPQVFTIIGSAYLPGRMEVKFDPIPQEARTVDYIYKRRPKTLYPLTKTGGSVAGTNATTTITGMNTAFAASDVGRLLRISGSTSAPTSWAGGVPPVFESYIASYASPTSVAVSDTIPADFTASGYTIADAIDLEPGAMTNTFLRCCEWQCAIVRKLDSRDGAMKIYKESLMTAKEADSRSFQGRYAGASGMHRIPITKMPMGPDQY